MKNANFTHDEWAAYSNQDKINMGYSRLKTIAVIGAKLTLMRKTPTGMKSTQCVVEDIKPSDSQQGEDIFHLRVLRDLSLIKYYGHTNWVYTSSARSCTKHEAVETGMPWSYCKHCDTDMRFDFTLGFVPAKLATLKKSYSIRS